MEPNEALLTPYRLRTIRTGVWATVFVLAALVAYAFMPGHRDIDLVPFLIVLAIAAIGVGIVAVLPWPKLFARGWGLRMMYAWSAADIVLITALMPFRHGTGGEIFFLYTFTTVFFSISYPRKAQAGLLAFTFVSFIGVLAYLGWPVKPAELILRLALLGILAYFARFLSQQLRGEMAARAATQAESERRAELLAAVADASRTLSALDTEKVLRRVVDATETIGVEAADLVAFDDDTETSRVVHSRGYPRGMPIVQAASAGISGFVREQGCTVVIEDYVSHERAVPELMRAGFHAVMATPVWAGGRLAAVLGAGTRARRPFTAQEREAFELLAALAGRALENAQRFEDERHAVERLAELDRMKSDFISTASHELRTPLTVIQGMGLTLARQWDDIEEGMRRDLLERMNANAERLHDIVGGLLDFSRIESGVELRRESVPIAEMARSVAEGMAPLLASHPVSFEGDLGATVHGDRTLLGRVLENLLANAATHTAAGTEVTVSIRGRGAEVEVAVEDAGNGIPPNDLPHLGSRFFRGGDPNTRPRSGTGLGLALAQEILRLHDSTLDIWSEVGRGSRFSFRLPRGRTATEGHRPAQDIGARLAPSG